MNRYIDAELLLTDNTYEWFDDWGNYTSAGQAIVDAPTADVVKVVHGEWIKHKPDPEVMRLFHQEEIALAMGENSIYWNCSECGSWGTPIHKYCPNCGSKMDGKKVE